MKLQKPFKSLQVCDFVLNKAHSFIHMAFWDFEAVFIEGREQPYCAGIERQYWRCGIQADAGRRDMGQRETGFQPQKIQSEAEESPRSI